MKIGDKVKVVSLARADKEHTNLKIGDIGTIDAESGNNTENESTSDIYGVDFGDKFVCSCESGNCDFSTNSYDMWVYQLELVE